MLRLKKEEQKEIWNNNEMITKIVAETMSKNIKMPIDGERKDIK